MADFRDAAQNEEPFSAAFATAGERWKQAAVWFGQRLIPKRKWTQFAATVQARHAAVNKFEAIETRIRDESQRSPKNKRSSLPDEAEALIAAAESPAGELPPAIERSSHFMLDARIKQFLSGLLNFHIPAVKIYTNQAADGVTRSYGADALTYRDKILFRAGKYNPRETAGIALLGHELTHAAQVKMESPRKPGQVTQPILKTQELQALANEAKVWQHLSSPSRGLVQGNQKPFPHSVHYPVSGSSLAISPSEGSDSRNRQINQIQSGQPRTALSSRELNLPPETNTALSSSPYLSAQQLNQIKEEVYRDLMDRIRIEFERGG